MNSAAEARLWVEANRGIVEETYQRFLKTGEWPTVGYLQRHFDRAEALVTVQLTIDSKPRVLNEARPVYLEYLTLQLRHLMWVPNARPLVTICVKAVQKAVESYLSDDENPFVSSEDHLTQPPSKLEGDFSARVYRVLASEYPSPFGGSSSSGDKWRIEVDSRFVRQFRDITSIEDFVVRQDIVRAQIAEQARVVATAFPVRSAFEPGEFTAAEQVLPSAVDEWEQDSYVNPAHSSSDFSDVKDPEALSPQVGTGRSEQEPILFISWSHGRSRAVAERLMPLLGERLPGVEVFFSPTSIEPGADPSRRMFDEGLLSSSALLVVLTHKSAASAYVIWETASAWALSKLVIPLFVEIEPIDVPGPLVGKVQGVHLSDRHDVDRAIRRFATHFGVVTPTDLSDKEYESLASTDGETEEGDAQGNLARLESELRGYVARWQTLYEGFQGSYDSVDRTRLAAEIQQILAESVRIVTRDALGLTLANELSTIATQAANVQRIRVMADGGMSFDALNAGCLELIDNVRGLLQS